MEDAANADTDPIGLLVYSLARNNKKPRMWHNQCVKLEWVEFAKDWTEARRIMNCHPESITTTTVPIYLNGPGLKTFAELVASGVIAEMNASAYGKEAKAKSGQE